MSTVDKQQIIREFSALANTLIATVGQVRASAKKFEDAGYGSFGVNEIDDEDLAALNIDNITANDLNVYFQSLDAMHRIFDDGEFSTILPDATLVSLSRLGWGTASGKLATVVT